MTRRRTAAALLAAAALSMLGTAAPASASLMDTYCVKAGPVNLCTPPMPV